MAHTIAPGSKVLVTGANGFIAAWIVRTLLERGHAVRGTARSAEKAQGLKKIFSTYGDKLEVVVVEDITKDGAFDEAVKGVDAVVHAASPFHMKADDPQELIKPAVHGTLSVLESTLKFGTNVRRVVVTSSCAAVFHVTKEPVTYTEKNWNTQSIEEVERLGRNAAQGHKYRASKTLAERSAWDFVEKNKDKIKWDLAVINPPFVFGPIINDIPNVESLGESARELYQTLLVEGSKSPEALLTQGSAWIDVRDIAEAHVRALEREEAGGERIIVSAGSFVWQDWIDVANSLSPNPIPSHSPLPRGVPSEGRKPVYTISYNTEKQTRILGIKYRTQQDIVRDALADFEARGW